MGHGFRQSEFDGQDGLDQTNGDQRSKVNASHRKSGFEVLVDPRVDERVSRGGAPNSDTAMDAGKAQALRKEKEEWKEAAARIFNFVARLLVSGLGKCGGRSYELEADKYGMHLMKKCEMNTQSAIWLQHFFSKQSSPRKSGWFEWISHLASSHPSSQERLAANQRTWQELNK